MVLLSNTFHTCFGIYYCIIWLYNLSVSFFRIGMDRPPIYMYPTGSTFIAVHWTIYHFMAVWPLLSVPGWAWSKKAFKFATSWFCYTKITSCCSSSARWLKTENSSYRRVSDCSCFLCMAALWCLQMKVICFTHQQNRYVDSSYFILYVTCHIPYLFNPTCNT